MSPQSEDALVVVRVPPVDRGRDRLRDLPLDKVRPDPANPRGEVGDVADLVASMREVGLLQPITVRYDLAADEYLIRMGARRWTAARQLGWTTIRAVVRDPERVDAEDDVRALEEMFFENNHRAAIDPVREARALRAIFRARGFGSIPALALHVGRSPQWAADRLALLDLPEEVQAQASAGGMTIREATSRAREVRGLPPRPVAAKPAAKASPAAPRTARADAIAAAIRREVATFRELAAEADSAVDAAGAIAELIEHVGERLDDLARRVENGAEIQ